MHTLDATDLGVLAALQTNARCSAAELARRVGRRESTVRGRMESLSARSIIRTYRADVDLDLVCATTTATVHAAVDLRELARVKVALQALPCVLGAEVVSGDRAIVVRVIARSIADLAAVVRRDLAPLGLKDMDIRVTMRPLVLERAAVWVGEADRQGRLRAGSPQWSLPARADLAGPRGVPLVFAARHVLSPRSRAADLEGTQDGPPASRLDAA